MSIGSHVPVIRNVPNWREANKIKGIRGGIEILLNNNTMGLFNFKICAMTTAAMVLGVLPLIMATGAGAVSRFNIGLVIATGIAIGTLFTLFVVPAVYLLIGETHAKQENKAKLD